MSKPKVLVTRRWPQAVEEKMAQIFDLSLNTSDTPLTEAEFTSALGQYDAILPTVTDRLPAAVARIVAVVAHHEHHALRHGDGREAVARGEAEIEHLVVRAAGQGLAEPAIGAGLAAIFLLHDLAAPFAARIG